MTQEATLQWGAVEFVHPETAPPAEGYLIHAMAAGTNFGNPKALIQVVKSLLTDGSLAVLEGWDNREAPIRLRISAPTSAAGPALAAAEAALMEQLLAEAKPPLTWTPPATDAATNVFDVVAAQLERDTDDGWDTEEEIREYRYYRLVLTCLPFVRTEEKVVVPVATATPQLIDACNSVTADWFAPLVALSATGGYVQAQNFSSTSMQVHRINLALGDRPYLRVTATIVNGDVLTFKTSDVGVGDPTLVAIAPSGVVGGATDYYLAVPADAGGVRMVLSRAASGTLTLRVHQLDSFDSLPFIGTARQQVRVTNVPGAAPTEAAIVLSDPTPAALGTDILIHTSRNRDFVPALRPYRVSSEPETTDAARVSGKRNTLASAMTFRISAQLLTEGTYALMALMSVTTSGTLNWQAKTVSSTGGTTVGSSVVLSGSVVVGVTAGYQILNLAAIPLPVVLAEADQMVELTLTGTSNMSFDDGWLCGLHDGVLTWLTDTDSLTWVQIRSPELGAARPSVYGGVGAKGANGVCVDWKAKSFGAHRFMPGLMQVFTVTSNSQLSQSEMELYPRGHSHVQADWTA